MCLTPHGFWWPVIVLHCSGSFIMCKQLFFTLIMDNCSWILIMIKSECTAKNYRKKEGKAKGWKREAKKLSMVNQRGAFSRLLYFQPVSISRWTNRIRCLPKVFFEALDLAQLVHFLKKLHRENLVVQLCHAKPNSCHGVSAESWCLLAWINTGAAQHRVHVLV